ncbi:unnamed protein product [Brachionus calyciflorus]|uniref:Uncharacterized protein n=1 Tax=Brachionus calyciflorus TaxID=104777 RepID=A0A814HEE8_9BILA|nr:unnamed protein product [Brachionus calyciflorus]
MKSFSLILIWSIFAFMLFVGGKADKPCKLPSKWKSNFYDRDDKAKLRSSIELFYDAENKQMRRIGYQKEGDNEDNLDTLLFFNEKIKYTYSFSTKKCEKSIIDFDWVDFDIPKNALYNGDQILGLTGSGLVATTWTAQVDMEGQKFQYVSLFTKTNCVPITVYLDNEKHNYQAFFLNVTVNAFDSDAFKIRTECL